MNRTTRQSRRTSAVTTSALATGAWDASAADVEALTVHLEPDLPAAAGASASLPATTSAWLDGLLGLHRPLRC